MNQNMSREQCNYERSQCSVVTMRADIWGLLGFSAPGGVPTVLTFHLAILLPFKKAPPIEAACKLPQQGSTLPTSGSK